jgi:hypothetical protein
MAQRAADSHEGLDVAHAPTRAVSALLPTRFWTASSTERLAGVADAADH